MENFKYFQVKIDDLVSTLGVSNVYWTAWERQFITNLDGKLWKDLSTKQKEWVVNLWEKI